MKTFQQFIEENSEREIPGDILKAVKIAYSDEKDKFIKLLRSMNIPKITEILDDINRNDLNSMAKSFNQNKDMIVPNNADGFN